MSTHPTAEELERRWMEAEDEATEALRVVDILAALRAAEQRAEAAERESSFLRESLYKVQYEMDKARSSLRAEREARERLEHAAFFAGWDAANRAANKDELFVMPMQEWKDYLAAREAHHEG